MLATLTDTVPPLSAREVYEFLSFEEFRLDLRHMAVDEMEEWSLWSAVVAFALGLLIGLLRAFIGWAERWNDRRTGCATTDRV
jgi:hypothetical protein